MSYASIKR